MVLLFSYDSPTFFALLTACQSDLLFPGRMPLLISHSFVYIIFVLIPRLFVIIMNIDLFRKTQTLLLIFYCSTLE